MVARGFKAELASLARAGGSELMKNWRPLLLSTTLAIWALAGWRQKASAGKQMQVEMAVRMRIAAGKVQNSYLLIHFAKRARRGTAKVLLSCLGHVPDAGGIIATALERDEENPSAILGRLGLFPHPPPNPVLPPLHRPTL